VSSACCAHGTDKKEYKIVAGKFERERYKHRKENIIKMFHRQIGCNDVDWIWTGLG
jgi:hypothetical protein